MVENVFRLEELDKFKQVRKHNEAIIYLLDVLTLNLGDAGQYT